MTVSDSSSCASTVARRNPAIWFVQPVQSADPAVTFESFRAGVILLAESVSPCHIGSLILHEGQHYRHDARLELVSNSLVQPVEASAETCPSAVVPKTFLNKESCVLQP